MKVIEPHLPVFKINTFIIIRLGNTNISANLHPDVIKKKCLSQIYIESDVINLSCFIIRMYMSKNIGIALDSGNLPDGE